MSQEVLCELLLKKNYICSHNHLSGYKIHSLESVFPIKTHEQILKALDTANGNIQEAVEQQLLEITGLYKYIV